MHKKAGTLNILLIRIIAFMLLCDLSYSSALPAEETQSYFHIDEAISSINISSALLYRESAPELTFEDVQKLQTGWKKNSKPNFNRNYSSNTYWFKIPLYNASNRTGLYITLNNTRLDYVDFYIPAKENPQKFKTGDKRVLTSEQPMTNPTFKFQLSPYEKSELYIRVQSGSSVSFNVTLRSNEAFGEYRTKRTIIQWAFFAQLILFLLISVRFNPAFAGKLEIYISIAVSSAALYLFCFFGEANNIFWPSSVYLKNTMIFIFNLIFQIFLLRFLSYFIKGEWTPPWLNKAFSVYTVLLCLFVPILALVESNYFRSVVTSATALATFGLSSLRQYFALRKGHYSILPITIIWCFFAIGTMIFICTLFGLLPYNFFTANIVLLIYPIDLVILSISLFVRHRKLAIEHSELKTKLEKLNQANSNNNTSLPTPNLDKETLQSSDQRSLRIQHVNGLKTLTKLIEELFLDQRLYLNENITLNDVAKKLDIRADQLSALLNKEMNCSFPTLINGYRVREACRLLEKESAMNILDIAFACGFGSRASFNRAFKQNMKTTPLDYRRKVTATMLTD